jgi:hypothetical protein
MRRLLFQIAAVGFLALGAAGAASACDDCPVYKKVVCYQTVVSTEVQKVPYLKEVVQYDDCGKPYCSYEVCYKQVEVAVTRQVPVVRYVKECD